MKSNIEILQEVLEQVVNQKKIDQWDQYFSPDYVSRGAPYIGMGFSRDTSENKHIINMVFPGSPAEGVLQVGDELLWVAHEGQRWETYEEIKQGIQGRQYKLGLRRGDQTLEVELSKDYFKGFDTHTDQAKSELREFMTKQFPDLKATIQLILADGDMVVCLMEYRGTHVEFKREAVWREAWFTLLSEGKIVEGWPIIDESSFFRHLGYQLIPPGS